MLMYESEARDKGLNQPYKNSIKVKLVIVASVAQWSGLISVSVEVSLTPI